MLNLKADGGLFFCNVLVLKYSAIPVTPSAAVPIITLIIVSPLLGNMANIQSVCRKKSGEKAQSVRSGRDHSGIVLSRQLPEAARTARHQKDMTRKNGVSIQKDRISAV